MNMEFDWEVGLIFLVLIAILCLLIVVAPEMSKDDLILWMVLVQQSF